MRAFRVILLLIYCLGINTLLFSQTRIYAHSSVLSTGNWYKIGTAEQGFYKIDGAMLSKLGITLPIPSNQLRLYGNGGKMLPEANASARVDDLLENAISVDDGGDGTFNLQDYFIFYAPGPHQWNFNASTKRYRFQKNIYTDSVWYFLTIGGQGKRISMAPELTATQSSLEGDAYFAYEKDEVNFLQSGKEWYGEEFSTNLGRSLSRDFDIPVSDLNTSALMWISVDVLGRSIGSPSTFDVRINNDLIFPITIPALTGAAYDPVGTPVIQESLYTSTANSLKLNLSFKPANANAQGWLNKLEWNGRVRFKMSSSKQLLFRDAQSLNYSTTRFAIENTAASTRVFDVSNFNDPIEQVVTREGTVSSFIAATKSLREFVAVSFDRLLKPVLGGKIANQNLHAAEIPQLIIVSPHDFINEAKRIGQFHFQKQGLRYLVADIQQIYNEFSSGSPDPTAIRDFVKMFYDKAGADLNKRPKYLLLFGDASYDYKNRITGNTNFVPAYQSASSLDILTSYTSDDYFGFLDDHEDINSTIKINQLDIGIGRIPVSTLADAKNVVDKIEQYASYFGPWRANITLVADDEDQNLHLKDAEQMSTTIESTNKIFQQEKIYVDAFPQESSAGGGLYPLVNKAIDQQIDKGNLIWNYSGHGGYKRLAEEAILEESMIRNWQNNLKLPLFITATCDFAPYDNPQIRSLGEQLILQPKSGAIALMTTTRAVFAFANKIINTNYLNTALTKQTDGTYLSLGDAVMRCKNYTYQTVSDALNNRKFTLLGDPALTLAFPKHHVVTTTINDIEVSRFADTIKALNQYTVAGEVRTSTGALLNDFNGSVYIDFYDKSLPVKTLANDAGSMETTFYQQSNKLYKGKVEVKNGKFRFSFIVPKDIDLKPGIGHLYYYAENGNIDAAGAESGWIVGGLGNQIKNDLTGPVIKAYLNDEQFENGATVNEYSTLIVHLSDASGLNLTSTGIGHDIIAVLDDNTNEVFILNDFFEATKGSLHQGVIQFPLPLLSEGLHRLKIRAWDVFNNPTEIILTFKVVKQKTHITFIKAYPNPFQSSTTISLGYDRNGEELGIKINIYTGEGKWIRSIDLNDRVTGNKVEYTWDGKTAAGIRVIPGVFIYQVIVKSSDGRLEQRIGRMIKYRE